METEQFFKDYLIIEKTILFLEENFQHQPRLEELAQNAGLSEFHFQRLFSRWVGISPKRFLQFLTKEHAKQLLERSRPLLDVALEAGLSGPGRLHDLFVNCEAMTPAEYKNKGQGLTIRYGVHATPFGRCLIGATDRGICSLSFLQTDNAEDEAISDLYEEWKEADLKEDKKATASVLNKVFSGRTNGERPQLHIFLKGTNFQIKVWEALLRIPPGCVTSYDTIAHWLGVDRASRAVGNAIAQNPIAFLIPCHRVIRKAGEFGKYKWGNQRKKAILAWESAAASAVGESFV